MAEIKHPIGPESNTYLQWQEVHRQLHQYKPRKGPGGPIRHRRRKNVRRRSHNHCQVKSDNSTHLYFHSATNTSQIYSAFVSFVRVGLVVSYGGITIFRIVVLASNSSVTVVNSTQARPSCSFRYINPSAAREKTPLCVACTQTTCVLTGPVTV